MQPIYRIDIGIVSTERSSVVKHLLHSNNCINICIHTLRSMVTMPSPFPFEFTPRTINCPVLCTVLFNQKQPPQLARLQPPLLRVKINSIYTVCQETSTTNVALRLHCLRPKIRCFCLTLIQFMYVSKGSIADPKAETIFRSDHREMHAMRHVPFNPHPRKTETEICHHLRLSWVAIVCLVLVAVVVFALILGLLKASLICCRQAVPKWKYDYLQPMHPFKRASW